MRIMKTNTAQKNVPDGWQDLKLASIFEFKNGLNKEKKFFGQGTPIINYVDVYGTGGLYQESILGKVDVNKSELERFNVKKGDIFFTRTSETLKEIGFSAVALGDFKDTVFSGFVLRARQKGKNLEPSYAKYCFKTPRARQEIKEKSSYTTRALTSGTLLNHVRIALPPLSEQTRIVKVLETWDKVIEVLAKKIEHKKEIKKGLMQNLLTGKIRLSGFSDEWHAEKLGNLCDIGTGKKNNQDKVADGVYPFFVRSPFVERINSYSFDGEAILVPGEGNIGKIFHYIKGKFDFHQRVYKVSDFNNGVCGRYVYYYLVKNFSKATKSDSVKATVDSLRLPTFTNFQIRLPAISEQDAIVRILDTANNEIATLEKKLSLLKDQKTHLLNNLITGIIRTPENI